MRHVKPLINISQKQGILFALFLVMYEFLTYISNDMILPGMYQVIREFHASPANIASAVTCFMVGGACLQFIIGPLSDAYGRRKVMISGVILFLISTILLAISQKMHQFLLERIFQGMGVCFISTIGYATLQEIFNDTDAVKLTALMASISIISPLLGPLVGSFIVLHATWREIFEIVAVLTVISLWGLWKYMPESVGQTTTEGHHIAPQPLNFKKIMHNYATLLSSPAFMKTLCTYGLMGVPCMIWIALSPVMIISHENSHSLYEYSLWQIPMFSAFIFANTLLQKWVVKFNLQQLMQKGIYTVIFNLMLSAALVHIFGPTYYAFIPGFIGYFFGYATASSPFYRRLYCLSTVPKGATAALISLFIMLIQSVGIELANHLFHGQNFYALAWLLFAIGASMAGIQIFKTKETETPEGEAA
jgi:DHA1 family multidrug/chloramphenicol efflux transport protein-like MFS transporter